MSIPKVRHVMWGQGRAEMPDQIRQWVDSFDQHHPDWTTEFWDDDRIRDHGLGDLQEVYDRADEWTVPDSVWQLRCDIARYVIVHQLGGMWTDADYQWYGPIDPHLAGASFVACWETDNLWLANGLIAATPGHPALRAVLAGLPANLRRHSGRRANWLAGPKYWTRIVRSRDDVTLLPSSVLHSIPWNSTSDAPPPDGSPAVHRWWHQQTLRSEGITA